MNDEPDVQAEDDRVNEDFLFCSDGACFEEEADPEVGEEVGARARGVGGGEAMGCGEAAHVAVAEEGAKPEVPLDPSSRDVVVEACACLHA